jgi:hypothetical protein
MLAQNALSLRSFESIIGTRIPSAGYFAFMVGLLSWMLIFSVFKEEMRKVIFSINHCYRIKRTLHAPRCFHICNGDRPFGSFIFSGRKA